MNNFTLMIMMLIQQEMKKCCSPWGWGGTVGVKEESTESVILGNYHQFSFQNDSINQFSLEGLQTLLILIFVATYKKNTWRHQI